MEDEAKKIQEAMKNMEVKDFGLMFIQTLSALAWQKMGLAPNPEGKEEIDLLQAKQAIDLCAAIFNVVSSSLDDKTKNELNNLISNLQINFVEKNK